MSLTKMHVTGMVLGKFLPPHHGHLQLIRFAQGLVDELTVVVGTLAREPIPGALRFEWMRQLCGGARVVHLTDENPQDPAERPDFWQIWRASLLRVLPRPPDYVFASEAYGQRLAETLGATFIPFDPGRQTVPISGTAIREAPLDHWIDLPPPVRAHFLRRVCVFGPESTGKSTLARRLAAHFQTRAVPEYARALLEAQDGRLDEADMPLIARGQAAAEAALARCEHEGVRRVLFCDTDPLTTLVWSARLYGRVAPEVAALAEAHDYDLYLLTAPDVPWVADVVRYLPDDRAGFFARCQAALAGRGRRFVVVEGGWARREATAIAAVQACLAAP